MQILAQWYEFGISLNVGNKAEHFLRLVVDLMVG
ncbi:lipoyl synthase [Stappia aggregata IAM 12614]|uniref:Lipoyl synthase n=1 Tax=Roseibium aggregatum (strain ATCC 25650 / DSM 13394 / JCM 20685 / NBRC 16684 / NCIMB 2208 / IAM 12614 / B1) TaxID=384765 RepID=A0NSV0_ROSAI|nr:lipoyl synthase [Stappia aggregata IAM 12614] [Roseibium aggregatum IAM 12614]